MSTLIVKTKPSSKNLVNSLPNDAEWILVDEDYSDNRFGVVIIEFEDELNKNAERALDNNDEVIAYKVRY